MKKRAFVTATLFVLSLIVAAQVAQADEPMLVNIPFAFVAGNVTLPAGEYRVQKLDGNSTVVLIRCSDGHGGHARGPGKRVANRIKADLQPVWQPLFPFAGLDGRLHPRKTTLKIASRKGNFASGENRDEE